MRTEVKHLHLRLGTTSIFVTHDQGEALTIADRVAVMTRGKVLQVAPPELIYAEPATPYVATFVGVANLVSSTVRDGVAETRFGTVPLISGEEPRAQGQALCLLRPEHFNITEAPDGPASTAGWEVIDRRFSGSEILLELRAADGERLWVEAGSRVRHLGLGDHVSVVLRDVETVAFGRKGATDPKPPQEAEAPATVVAPPAGTSR